MDGQRRTIEESWDTSLTLSMTVRGWDTSLRSVWHYLLSFWELPTWQTIEESPLITLLFFLLIFTFHLYGFSKRKKNTPKGHILSTFHLEHLIFTQKAVFLLVVFVNHLSLWGLPSWRAYEESWDTSLALSMTIEKSTLRCFFGLLKKLVNFWYLLCGWLNFQLFKFCRNS